MAMEWSDIYNHCATMPRTFKTYAIAWAFLSDLTP